MKIFAPIFVRPKAVIYLKNVLYYLLQKLSNCSHQVFAQSHQKDFPTKCAFFCYMFWKSWLKAINFEIGFHSPTPKLGEWVIYLCLGGDNRDQGKGYTLG